MRYETWIRKFQPLHNHLNENAAIDGRAFLPTGHELEFVRKQPPHTVWSFLVCDIGRRTIWTISAGYHVVNLMGYLITTKPFDPSKFYDIRY